MCLDESRATSADSLESLKCQEDAVKKKAEELQVIIADGSSGIVKRNKAKAELAILRNDDPITLRTARIQQEAAVNRMTLAAKKAEETVEQSETALERATHARKEAIRLKVAALAAAKNAEERIPAAQAAFETISAKLDEITKMEKTGKGSIYFIQADLNASRKYLPKQRFVVAQKRASEIIELASGPPAHSTM